MKQLLFTPSEMFPIESKSASIYNALKQLVGTCVGIRGADHQLSGKVGDSLSTPQG
jgi:hypothetical protein